MHWLSPPCVGPRSFECDDGRIGWAVYSPEDRLDLPIAIRLLNLTTRPAAKLAAKSSWDPDHGDPWPHIERLIQAMETRSFFTPKTGGRDGEKEDSRERGGIADEVSAERSGSGGGSVDRNVRADAPVVSVGPDPARRARGHDGERAAALRGEGPTQAGGPRMSRYSFAREVARVLGTIGALVAVGLSYAALAAGGIVP